MDAPDQAAAARIDRSERLLTLVVALLGSEVPVSRPAIRAGVPGYAASPSDSAFERMFERDKDELRSMGVPIDTVRDANDEVVGYRIRPEDYAYADLRLTTAERAAVVVAAQAWEQASLARAAGTALVKLDLLGQSGDRADALPGALHQTDADAALPPLMAAVGERTVVTFAYRGRADVAASIRTVTPWGLRSTQGAWFCIGHDHDRGAQRTFRLPRIAGAVRPAVGPDGNAIEAVAAPPGFDVAAVSIAPDAGPPVVARVRVAPGRAAAVRRLAVDEEATDRWQGPLVTVAAGSMAELVAAVCGAGPDACVLEPPEAVTAVRASLRATLTKAAR